MSCTGTVGASEELVAGSALMGRGSHAQLVIFVSLVCCELIIGTVFSCDVFSVTDVY